MVKVADPFLTIHPWKIIEAGFHPEKSRVSESLFSLANEYHGVRGYFDEGYSGSSLRGTYFNGVYEAHDLKEPSSYKGISNRICFMVNTVDWLYTRIELEGETLDLARAQFSDFQRELDFRTGELHRQYTWHTANGKTLNVAFARFLSLSQKEQAYQQIILTPLDFSGPVIVTLGIDYSSVHEMYGENFWTCPRNEQIGDIHAILGVSKNIGQTLFAGFKLQAADQIAETALLGDQFSGTQLTMNLTQGQPSQIDRLTVLFTPRDPKIQAAETWRSGLERLSQASAGRYAQALAENASRWQQIWEQFDITIEGDPATQQGIRFCIFQLQQTCQGILPGSNIGAKGLTGEAYNGNTFWDTETYCLPYYLFSNPRAARALIDFRYQTLPQALERARQLDCTGACFPVATVDGTESCTLWQHANLQFQPTTAVAYAIWHYVKITGDRDFLENEGIELLVPICRFLASRGQWSPRRQKFGYYAVMGPDEFQMMVNNSAYTNLMAKQTFTFTLKVLDDMELSAAERLTMLGCSPAERAEWRRMAEQMIIPYDTETKLYEQHEGFFDLPHLDIATIPVEDFPLYHHWSYDRIYRNDMIKQPDVLMFMFLYNQSFSLAEKRANFEYYEPRCIHESSLSPSVHSIFAAELGYAEQAFEFFQFATRIDLDNYNRNTAEGIHMTSIAAAWMNIVYGFGGMRSDGEQLIFNPTIPAHWQSYSFRITYQGALIEMYVTQNEACIRLIHGEPVWIELRGAQREITPSGLTFPLHPGD